MSQPPTSIGKYDVEGVIGEGAMGVVYLAMDRVLGRRVAIKVMSDAIAKDDDLRERFLREAQAAGSLQHPNVVTIYDFGEVEDHLYIAMEYVEGEDLEDLLAQKVRLPLDAKLGLIIDVLQGLAFAHKRGVVHRDIKPANIRLDDEGRARLMDFGIAHLASSDMTRTGMMLGTPSYMAPEQIVGGAVTAATDIFSVGAVLYELLTGTRPFRGNTLQALMYQVLSQTPAPLHRLDPELPAPLNDVVMRALQKEPGARYASALEMASELTTVRANLVPEGPRHTLSLRAAIDSGLALRRSGVRARTRRRQGYFAAGALAVTVLVAVALQLPRPAPRVGDPSALQDSGGRPPAAETTAAPAVPAVPPAPPAVSDRSMVDPPAAAPEAGRTGPSASEVAIARRIQASALAGRVRAVEAGALLPQLRAGDAHNEVAEARLERGRVDDAVTSFGHAAAAWAAAEREARQAVRDRAAAVDVAAAGPDGVPQQAATAPAYEPPPSPAAPRQAPAPAPATPREPVDHGSDVAAVIAAYARALQSRDIAQLQRAYPGMTSEQRGAFEEFFRSTRSLDARLAVASLHVDGASAQAQLTGTYEFVTSGGSSERRPVSYRALLRLEQGAWQLVSVR